MVLSRDSTAVKEILSGVEAGEVIEGVEGGVTQEVMSLIQV